MTSEFPGADGPSCNHAYGEAYLPDAMECLGEFFDYAANDYGAAIDEVADLFVMSLLSREFASGEPRLVSGVSGAELFALLNEEQGGAADGLPTPALRVARTPEYWAGWVSAYVQWFFDIDYGQLFRLIPVDDLVTLYWPWHETSEERFCAYVEERMRSAMPETNVGRLRRALGITQRELAHRSGVSLRSIQMYEQRRKDINRAQARSLRALSKVLHCPMESLLEPSMLAGVA